MDACIRNSLYEEAVDIVAFANTLERRHLIRYHHQRVVGKGTSSKSSSSVSRSTSNDAIVAEEEEKKSGARHTMVIAGLVRIHAFMYVF